MNEIVFDPMAPELVLDPYPHYRRLREEAPVFRSSMGFWILSRHDDVRACVSDPKLQRQYYESQVARLGEAITEQLYFQILRLMVLFLDDPDHRRVRKVFGRAFTPRRVAELHPRVEAIANGLIDRVAGERQLDIVADFAQPLPRMVIGELLGVPLADQDRVAELTRALNPALASTFALDEATVTQVNDAVAELRAYFGEMAVARRRAPADDLFSAMVTATDEDGGLTEDELVANAIILYLGGNETTAGSIALSTLALHREPGQWALLCEADELGPVVEELLRFETPAQAASRVTAEPVTFSGVEIPAGEKVLAYLGSACHDPGAFPGDPDRLDLTRRFDRTIAFGHGPSLCVGHALARQEMAVAFDVLRRRCPRLTLETLEPAFTPSPVLRGIQTLPAHW